MPCPAQRSFPHWIAALIDGAEFNNASSDRALGFQDVSKVCMLQSFHQSAEQFEILFNKDLMPPDALPGQDDRP